MAIETWKTLRRSAERVLCSSEQPTDGSAVPDVDDVRCENLIAVASSHSCGEATGDREENLTLAASGLSECERACQKRVPRGLRGAVGSGLVE